jgi:defect-in-organelle-trafficking protein DotD
LAARIDAARLGRNTVIGKIKNAAAAAQESRQTVNHKFLHRTRFLRI